MLGFLITVSDELNNVCLYLYNRISAARNSIILSFFSPELFPCTLKRMDDTSSSRVSVQCSTIMTFD
ncbi:unnamed protein product [Heterobilharzia americana]|nr:unnamed protein product [Heterobilharzia americana]